MIKKLRRQFIMIAMLSVFIVLVLIIGGINVANYVNVNRNLDARLELITANGGSFPTWSFFDAEINLESGEMLFKMHGNSEDFRPSRWKNRGFSEESQYVTRYFTVFVDSSGTIAAIDTGNIAAISAEEAANYAYSLFEKGKVSGSAFLGNYKYMATDASSFFGDGYTMYVFLDAASELATARAFLIVSLGISAFGFLVVFLLVLFFSKLVVRPMAESYEKQKRFITDASHEIKTPLTIIDANTEILEMMEGESEWTTGIRKQIKRLTLLTEKLVFLSRMDEEGTKPELADFNISEAILDVAEGFQAVAETKGKSLELSVASNLTYRGDEKNIRQMVSLLLDNAMKYSDENGKIALTFAASGKNPVLTVWNTVEDITPGNHEELFDRFYRRDASHNSKTGGFGIGLSVVQAIVLAHKGKITAKSEDGKSLTFTISL